MIFEWLPSKVRYSIPSVLTFLLGLQFTSATVVASKEIVFCIVVTPFENVGTCHLVEMAKHRMASKKPEYIAKFYFCFLKLHSSLGACVCLCKNVTSMVKQD